MWKYIVSLWVASVIVAPDTTDTRGLEDYYFYDNHIFYEQYHHLWNIIETSDRFTAFRIYNLILGEIEMYRGPIDSVRVDSIFIH